MKKHIKNLEKKLKKFDPKLKEECGVFGISKAVRYTGIGGLDTSFGFFFGFIKAYIISVCIFSGIHIVYNYDKWPINLDKSYAFPYLEKGSTYLIKEFPNENKYQKTREKIENI